MKTEEELDKLFRCEDTFKQIKEIEEQMPENTATDDCLIDDIGDITEWIRKNIGEEYV